MMNNSIEIQTPIIICKKMMNNSIEIQTPIII